MAEVQAEPSVCAKRNVHGRSLKEIKKVKQVYEHLSFTYHVEYFAIFILTKLVCLLQMVCCLLYNLYIYVHIISVCKCKVVCVCVQLYDHWEATPSFCIRLDIRSLLQDAAIEDVSTRAKNSSKFCLGAEALTFMNLIIM